MRARFIGVNPDLDDRALALVLIDIGLLKELQAFQDEDGHVTLRPASDKLLREWAEKREDEEHPHWLTKEIQDAIIDRQEIM